MGRGKTKLSPAQEAHLEYLADVHQAYKANIAKLKIEARRWVEERTRELVEEYERAIYDAIQMDIPKSRIYNDALGTSSPNYVYDVEKRWDAKRADLEIEMPTKPVDRYSFGKLIRGHTGMILVWVVDAEDAVETEVFGHTGEGYAVVIVGDEVRKPGEAEYEIPEEVMQWAAGRTDDVQ